MWSFVVVGNLAFFYCRYRIAGKRRRAANEHGPIVRIGPDNCFSPIEREALAYLPWSIKQRPENLNRLIISAVSIVVSAGNLAMVLLY